MDAVKNGGDRQELHERIRELSMEAAAVVKQEGGKNDLIERIAKEPMFGMSLEDLQKVLEPKNFVGRAPQQVEEYITEQVQLVLDENKDSLIDDAELTV